jgi:hypothetical protein
MKQFSADFQNAIKQIDCEEIIQPDLPKSMGKDIKHKESVQ